MNSDSVECTSGDFFLRLFGNYVYHQFHFPNINKRGGEVGIKAGGVGKFFNN